MPCDFEADLIFAMRFVFAAINLALSLLLSQSAFAGDFAYTKDELAQAAGVVALSANHVARWCNNIDGSVIYGNIANQGFHQCGMLQLPARCDASGQKYLGSGAPPHGFLDCDLGPRIQVLKGGKALVNSQYIEYSRSQPSQISYPTFSDQRFKGSGNQYFDQLDRLLLGR